MELVANLTLNNEALDAQFDISEITNFDALFEIKAAGTTWGSIDGNITNQTDLYNILSSKADSVTIEADLEAINNTITENYQALDNKIDSIQSDLSEDISALSQTVTNNNTTINNRVNSVVESFDNDIENVNTAIQNEAELREQEDNLLNDNINSLSVGLTSEISNRQSAINDLQTSINDLNETVALDYTVLDTKINTTQTTLQNNIDTLSGITTSNYNDITQSITNNVINLNTRITGEVSILNSAIANEETTRANADNNLQSQIDAITSSSDVTDIVGTYAQLQTYNTSSLLNNSIIKVLQDESREGETTYYRWVITDGTGEWVLIGEEGPYYTKSEADSTFVPTTRTINNKPLSNNITLTARDTGALPDTTTIGDGILTLQKNGINIDTFSANASTAKTINISVPTDTSDLTNNAGFLTDADLTILESTVNSNTNNINTLTSRLNTVDLTLNTKQEQLTAENAGNGIEITTNDGTLKIINTQTSAIWGNITGTLSNQTDLQNDLDAKQDVLVSGVNLKTINSTSLLGSGDIVINPSPDLDNLTIAKNSSDELQAIGVIDNNTGSALKTWTGTKAQYDAIVTKDADTLYWLTDAKIICLGENAVGNFSRGRNVGEIVQSSLPLTDAGLRLLDGGLIQGDGIYKGFVDYIADLYAENPSANYFCNEEQWQQSITSYGVCGKFVYDSENNTVRLPKITGIIEGTTVVSALGDLVEAGLPDHIHTVVLGRGENDSASGVWFDESSNHPRNTTHKTTAASASNSIYGNSSTVQPQTIKVLYYIVIATSVKTDEELNIDNIVTDLNGKADVNLTNVTDTAKVMMAGMGMPINKYVDLTLGASGAQYIAPANGYFFVCKNSSASNQYLRLTNISSAQMAHTLFSSASSQALRLPVPAKKGDTIQADYTAAGTTVYCRFIYAQGSESEFV